MPISNIMTRSIATLSEKAGMRVVHSIDPEIHDRSFALDNGFISSLDAGLISINLLQD